MDDGLQYRAPITRSQLPGDAPVASAYDEQNINTLIVVRDELHRVVDEIDSMHAFEVMKNYPKEEATANLLRQIEVAQEVYAKISPVVKLVDDAIQAVSDKSNPNR